MLSTDQLKKVALQINFGHSGPPKFFLKWHKTSKIPVLVKLTHMRNFLPYPNLTIFAEFILFYCNNKHLWMLWRYIWRRRKNYFQALFLLYYSKYQLKEDPRPEWILEKVSCLNLIFWHHVIYCLTFLPNMPRLEIHNGFPLFSIKLIAILSYCHLPVALTTATSMAM